MPVDPQVQFILDFLASADLPDLSEQSPEEARAAFAAMPSMGEPPVVGSARDAVVPSPDGDIPIRIYTPEGDGPFAALAYFHGGGWVIGSIETHDDTCRAMCQRAGVVVVSPDYRLAPEHPYPAAADDCFAVTCWVADHATSLGIDPTRLAVGGDSAGGNLAAVAALRARDEDGPSLAAQLLVYPVTDFDPDTASMIENGEGYFLTRTSMQWFYDQYTSPDQRTDPYAAPLRATDLTGLPPAIVVTAEFDPLRDEGESYAAALETAGNSVQLTRYDGLIHGFFSMFGGIEAANVAFDATAAQVRTALGA